MTMSSGRQGWRLPSFVTGKRSASSVRTRRATNLASASLGFPPSSPPQQSRWYSTAQSSLGEYLASQRSASSSPYTMPPIWGERMFRKTKFAASRISLRERKFRESRIFRGSPSSASPAGR